MAKIEPHKRVVGLLLNKLTDLNSANRTGSKFVVPGFPMDYPTLKSECPKISVSLISNSGSLSGVGETDTWDGAVVQIDVWTKRGQVLTKTVTGESLGTISNSPRLSFDYLPNTVSNLYHAGSGFSGSGTEVDHDDDFTNPGTGTFQYAFATQNVNFNTSDLTTYSGEAITADYAVKLSGEALADYYARNVIEVIKSNWKTDETTANILVDPEILSNDLIPFDEEFGMFRRSITIRFKGLNIGS